MKAKSYKAAIYRDIGKIDIVDLPYPECGDEDVIVKNLLGGICGADVNAFFKGGDPHMIWKDYEFGHEMISEVVEVGKDVKDIHTTTEKITKRFNSINHVEIEELEYNEITE